MPDIEIKRGYEVLSDNNVRFGIRVTNISDFAVSDMEVILDYTESLFKMEGNKIQKLGAIPPSNTRTVEFLLKPLGCIHKVNIEALISYRDPKWEKHIVTMQPKEVHCVCPFLKPKKMQRVEFLELSNTGHTAETGLNFKGVPVEQLTSYLTDTCGTRHFTVDEFPTDNGRMLYLASESIGEKAYYLLTALIQETEGLTKVMLRAVSDKPHGLNGFLNEIVADLRHVVSTVQSAREIGVIKKEQVINIIDSVVQRTTFAGGEGSASVNIKDSVVQRTEIKGDEKKKISEEERLRKEREKQERIAREREELNPQKKKDGFSFKKFFAVTLVLGVLLLGYWMLEPGATDGPETLKSSPLPTPNIVPNVAQISKVTPTVFPAPIATLAPVQTGDYNSLELSPNFKGLADALKMTPRGVIWAQFINLKLASGTPIEEYASEMVQPAGFYGVPLAAMYAADYSSTSWIELHDIGITNQAIQPVMSEGKSNVIATRPFIYGHTINVEKTRQLMADPSSMDSAYLDFQIVLEGIDVDNTVMSAVSNSPNQYADLFYSGLSDAGNGLVKREMGYHLNLGGASLTSQYEGRAANSLANGFTSYDVTQNNNILKVTVIGNLENVLNEAI
jgi:hypothetical protein